jgi:hypothetical protein
VRQDVAPHRKPQVGLQRPKPKPAGKSKETPKNKQESTYLDALNSNPKANPKEESSLASDKNHKNPENANDAAWKQVGPKGPKYLTCS